MAPHLDKQLGQVHLSKMHLHSLLSLTSDSKSKDSIMHEGDFITSHLYSSTGLWPKDTYTAVSFRRVAYMLTFIQANHYVILYTTISNNIKMTNK